MAPPPSSSRALNAILPLVPTSPYEAHQKARTFASRYAKAKQYDTAIDVLFQSARELFKTGQPGSGTDLAGFLLEVYDEKGERVSDESRERLTQLIALTGDAGAWRKTVIDKSVSWSAKHGECPAGDPALNHYIGELLYREGAFEQAEHHLLQSGRRDSARVLASMFVDWANSTSPPTYAPFALRGTLPYLLNGSILAARTFITHFREKVPKSSEAPVRVDDTNDFVLTTDAVVNFCQLAVFTCQRAQGDKNKVVRESWVRLCGTYQAKDGLLAQPEVRRMMQELATLYFAIPPPRAQAASPFGDIMASLLGGGAPGGGTAPATRMLAPPPAAGGLD